MSCPIQSRPSLTVYEKMRSRDPIHIHMQPRKKKGKKKKSITTKKKRSITINRIELSLCDETLQSEEKEI